MPRPAEIRLIRDQSQDGDDRAHRNDEAVLQANAARENDGRQAPDQHPRGPVERPCKFRGGSASAPPLRWQVQRRNLEIDGQVDAEPEERFDQRISLVEVVEAVAGAHLGHTYQRGCIEHGDDQMLRRVRRGPVARQKDDEDHRGEKRIGEPVATPYPERKNGASGGNQELDCVRLGRIKAAAEKSGLHSRAEKTNRANDERFLDTVAIEPGSRNGGFGSRVADGSEDQKNNTGGLLRWPQNHVEQAGGCTHNDQGEDEQDQPQENVGGAQIRDGFLFQKLVLRLGEEALADPVRQEFAGAQSLFAGRTVESHAGLPKRRPIWTSTTSIATPLTTK